MKIYIQDAEFKNEAEKNYSCPTYLHKPVNSYGVLYPPKSLHPEVLNIDLLRTFNCTSEDIWIWVQAIRNNSKIFSLEENLPKQRYVKVRAELNNLLKNHVSKGGKFGEKLVEILNYYSIEERLFAEYKFVLQYEKLEKIKSKDRDFYSTLDPQVYPAALSEWYREKTGEWLNLDNPSTFNDKIQWSKLYDSTELKTKLTDKVLVRQWISEKIGEKYLVPLLGVWDSFDQIDFDKLPNRFVLKTNHGSGFNYIVKDKKTFDVEDAREKFNKWMKINFAFNYGFELHYLNIVPKITAEKYIEEFDQVYDYKFFCFDGHLKFIWVDTDRYTAHKRTLFTPEWEKMSERIHWENSSHEIPKPKNFSKMIEIAELLSKDFAHARIDFYEVDGRLFFGEITFTCGSGSEKFIPRDFGIKVGNWFNLPKAQPIPILRINS